MIILTIQNLKEKENQERILTSNFALKILDFFSIMNQTTAQLYCTIHSSILKHAIIQFTRMKIHTFKRNLFSKNFRTYKDIQKELSSLISLGNLITSNYIIAQADG
ncbi:hypothetical protein FGO68_gene11191 [Halteria grandinella]|uniref:Uncharacterized protein n=1 Tax=Halteria grandinella TaxID=5974 RepID=A0A8J8NRP9_HALGN|nr:hypothetical protein FGO68_gene11191 [Halteria grandinella]